MTSTTSSYTITDTQHIKIKSNFTHLTGHTIYHLVNSDSGAFPSFNKKKGILYQRRETRWTNKRTKIRFSM